MPPNIDFYRHQIFITLLIHLICKPIIKNMSNRVTHFEIPSDNPETSMKFFTEAFGWTFQQLGDRPYWLAISGDEGAPGINGAIMQKRVSGQPLVNSILVDDIDEAVKNIEKAGGRIHIPKMYAPGYGCIAFFADPDGNMHGIMQPEENIK
jgi:predicted enzyme related to lactoylglutathione lyase